MDKLASEYVDILGEISNICMGNAATTLSMMLNAKVDITVPMIDLIKRSEILDDYEKTCVFVQIHYVRGLEGNNVLILNEKDVLTLTDLMMGGDGTTPAEEITDLHLSAIAEAMNQMMGTSATAMATMLDSLVDISTPTVNLIDVESVKIFERVFESENEKYVKVAFGLDVGDGVLNSMMIQLYPVEFALEMCRKFRQKRTHH